MPTRLRLTFLCALAFTGCEFLDSVAGDGSGEGAVPIPDAGGEDSFETLDQYAPIHARFEPSGDDFYRMPWPSDLRVDADGMIETSDFPDTGVGLFERYKTSIDGDLNGWSLAQVLYIQLDADPGESAWPDPVDSLSATGPVQLIALDDACGERIPIEVAVNQVEDAYIGANVLTAVPVPGFVLEPGARYAFVVLRDFGAEAEMSLRRDDAFAAALEGTSANDALNTHFAPLRDCLAQDPTLDIRRVAIATVMTTIDPIHELRAIRDYVWETADAPVIDEWAFADDVTRAGYEVYRGRYETPMFQDGTSPYQTTGGDIHFDADGRPIEQRTESVPFAVAVPTNVDPPLRLAIWVDGTGAGQTTWVRSSVTQALLRNGFVVANYVAQFHDTRATPGSNVELHSFNYLNPDSFRNTFRQQVADTSYFVRAMLEARDQMPDLPTIDDETVVYGGQSQGSLVGTMTAAVEPRLDTFMLNGVGGYLSITAVERVDPFDIAELIANVADINPDFDRTHPLMALAQLAGDSTDPHSFARYWAGWDGNPSGVNILLTNGIDDTTTPQRSMNSLVVGGDLSVVDPGGWDPDPFGVGDVETLERPFRGNRVASDGTGRTHAAFLSGTTGHFTIYDREDVRNLAIDFLVTGEIR